MERKSLAGRALLALILMVGFYVLALFIIGALLFIPYAEAVYGNLIHLKLALACICGALAIGWAILPRFDSFEPSGPKLEPDENPRLFDKLSEIAAKTDQEMPEEVYLVPDMNAFVSSRGGWMGFGSRRVMGVGLPLLQVTSVSEFEAILAHEFGHYHGGDTKLGPWIYKTRSAIGRTLENLGDEGWLHLPFRWYGNLFMRITQAISRAQEFTADRLAATIVGARPLIEGLKRVHAEGPAFSAYWRNEAIPVLQAGFHAPLLEGFDRFLNVPRIRTAVQESLESEMEDGEGDPYDSHPPLRDRIAAVEELMDQPTATTDEAKAITLLGNARDAEKSLVSFLAIEGDASQFEEVDWEETVGKIFVPLWRENAADLSESLRGVTLRDLPAYLRSEGQKLARRTIEQDVEIPDEYIPQILGGPIGCCVVTALVDAGWELSAEVGDVVTLRKDKVVIEPFDVVARIYGSPEAGETWIAGLAEAGIAGLPLGGGRGTTLGQPV